MKKTKNIIVLLLASLNYFSLNAQENPSPQLDKHTISISLPNSISLSIKINQLAHWKESIGINAHQVSVAKHIARYSDSIAQKPTASHILNIQTDANKDYEKIYYRFNPSAREESVFRDGEYMSIKSNYDTLLITEKINQFYQEPFSDTKIPYQISYLFSAKNLADIKDIDPETLLLIQAQADSFFSVAQAAVHNPKAKWYQSTTKLDLSEKESIKSTFRHNKGFGNFINNLKIGVGYGITVYNNKISPAIDISLGYAFNRHAESIDFVGVNLYQFYAFDPNNIFKSTNTFSTLNLEIGSARRTSGFIHSKTSFGCGVLILQEKMGLINNSHWENKYLFNMLFNYAISNTITANMMFAGGFKKNNEIGIFGVGLKYNL